MKFTSRTVVVGILALASLWGISAGVGQKPPRSLSRNLLAAAEPRRQREDAALHLEENAVTTWRVHHDYAKAEEMMRRSETMLGREPGTTDGVAADLGDMLDEQGRSREAFVYYGKLMHNPLVGTMKNPARMFRYAQLSEHYNQPQEATAAYADLINAVNQADPLPGLAVSPADNDPARLCALGHVALGWYRRNARDPESKNLTLLRKGVSLQPDMAIGYLCLGLALKEKNQTTEAGAEFDQAQQLGNPALQAMAQRAMAK